MTATATDSNRQRGKKEDAIVICFGVSVLPRKKFEIKKVNSNKKYTYNKVLHGKFSTHTVIFSDPHGRENAQQQCQASRQVITAPVEAGV